MTGAGTRTARWLVVAVVLALTAGCGLSANSKPRVIAADDLPAELLDPNPSSSTTLGQSPATTSVVVYFLVQESNVTRLVGVAREVKDSRRPRDRLAALLVPPSPAEQTQGLLTSIPADTVLIDTKLDNTTGELTINLSRSLFDIQGQELRNAFAQLVWTATDIPGVRQVKFLVDGKEYRVPDQDGIEQPGAVTRANYATLQPAPVTTTVPAPVTTTVAPPP
jgi:spore germination protein GerM